MARRNWRPEDELRLRDLMNQLLAKGMSTQQSASAAATEFGVKAKTLLAKYYKLRAAEQHTLPALSEQAGANGRGDLPKDLMRRVQSIVQYPDGRLEFKLRE